MSLSTNKRKAIGVSKTRAIILIILSKAFSDDVYKILNFFSAANLKISFSGIILPTNVERYLGQAYSLLLNKRFSPQIHPVIIILEKKPLSVLVAEINRGMYPRD